MAVGVVTMMYNEEILAPMFFKHYDWADEIHVICDIDSTDNTTNICKSSGVEMHFLRFPDMMDAGIKQAALNHVFHSLTTDWGIMVDADEFVFHDVFTIPDFLEQLPTEVDRISAWLWNVYRHVSDKNIDVNCPPKYQRRHGDPDFDNWYNKHYIKRCIAKPKDKPDFNIGCHDFSPNPNIPHVQGAHWKMADPELAIIRRIKNGRDRQSEVNKKMNWQCHDFHITEEEIREECKKHENDPLLF